MIRLFPPSLSSSERGSSVRTEEIIPTTVKPPSGMVTKAPILPDGEAPLPAWPFLLFFMIADTELLLTDTTVPMVLLSSAMS